MGDDRDGEHRFERVGSNRNLDKIMSSLRGAILRGDLRPGEKLPSEPALASELGVSRPVLREALKALEVSGYLHVQRGYGGGRFVSAPEPEEFHTIKSKPLSGLDIDARQVMDVRFAVEPAAAALVAGGGHAAEAAKALRQLAVPGARPARVVNSVAGFHVALVEAAGNPVFTAVMHSLRGAMAVALNQRVHDVEWRTACRDSLALVLENVDGGDGAGADKAMRHHLIEHEQAHGIGDGH